MARKPMSFQVRLMLVIMITVLLPSVFVNWLSFSVLKKRMLTDATSWLTGLTENSGEAMDTYIQLVNGISKNPEYDVTLMNIFENHRLNYYDEEAHMLCHPTNCAFRGNDLFTANLGRWHITRIRDVATI